MLDGFAASAWSWIYDIIIWLVHAMHPMSNLVPPQAKLLRCRFLRHHVKIMPPLHREVGVTPL